MKLNGSTFANVSGPFATDATFDYSSGTINYNQGGSPDITGIAFTNADPSDSTPPLYAIASNGTLYSVEYDDAQSTGSFADDTATLHLLSLNTPNNNSGLLFTQFSGLTGGPVHAENGRFANTLFATDDNGGLYAFDASGQPANVFVGGASRITTALLAGASFIQQLDYQGLTFSPIDYNLWHTTPTRGDDPGHGEDPTFDFNAARASAVPDGGQSFYFGLEIRESSMMSTVSTARTRSRAP